MGTWIETRCFRPALLQDVSFPSWERGLKLIIDPENEYGDFVVPLAGTWIETNLSEYVSDDNAVVPLAGTWIETRPPAG